jgi:uncharacterized coiled-coil protein SlyX
LVPVSGGGEIIEVLDGQADIIAAGVESEKEADAVVSEIGGIIQTGEFNLEKIEALKIRADNLLLTIQSLNKLVDEQRIRIQNMAAGHIEDIEKLSVAVASEKRETEKYREKAEYLKSSLTMFIAISLVLALFIGFYVFWRIRSLPG